MRIKVDEDLPQAAIRLLREHGYDAAGVYEQGMSGWKDEALWKVIQKEKRFLVTADKGFADIRLYSPGSHEGVLILRPIQQGIRPVVELLKRVLDLYRFEDLHRCVVVASPGGVRVRCPK